jgi:primosomal protein N' (replication factor Y)
MRVETERAGHANVFSRELLEAIQNRLSTGEQTMLFLNRRGFSSSLVCPKCGYVSECHQCSIAHTYHKTGETLRCHLCGCAKAVPAKCPQCGDPAFRYAGFGTQRVETVMNKCFPKARIARLDADTTTRKSAYEDILGAFRDGKIDILVGTQMIAKGLHFPNVTLVGVVFADLSLHVPDFRAGERTFQLIAQVAGRAGRGDVSGDVYIQTYTPHHTAIQAARRLDYEGFCAEELEFRRELDYPPAAHLVCLTFRGRHEDEVKLAASQYARALDAALQGAGARVSEATPAPLAKIKNVYRYQIIIRNRLVSRVNAAVKHVYRQIPLPKTTALSIDVDALDLM